MQNTHGAFGLFGNSPVLLIGLAVAGAGALRLGRSATRCSARRSCGSRSARSSAARSATSSTACSTTASSTSSTSRRSGRTCSTSPTRASRSASALLVIASSHRPRRGAGSGALTHVVDEADAGTRLDVVLARLTGFSRSHVAAAMRAGAAQRQRRGRQAEHAARARRRRRLRDRGAARARRAARSDRARHRLRRRRPARGRQAGRDGDASGARRDRRHAGQRAARARRGAARRAHPGRASCTGSIAIPRACCSSRRPSARWARSAARCSSATSSASTAASSSAYPDDAKRHDPRRARPRPAQPHEVRDPRRRQAGGDALRAARKLAGRERADVQPRDRAARIRFASTWRRSATPILNDPIYGRATRACRSRARRCTPGACASNTRARSRCWLSRASRRRSISRRSRCCASPLTP